MSSLLRLHGTRSLGTSAVRLYPALPTCPVHSPDEAGPSQPTRTSGRPRKVVDPNEPSPRLAGRSRKVVDPNEPIKRSRPVRRTRLASAVATDGDSGAASTSAGTKLLTKGDSGDAADASSSMSPGASTTATRAATVADTDAVPVIDPISEAPPTPRAGHWKGPFSEDRSCLDLLSVALGQRKDDKLRRKALNRTEFYEQGERPEGVAAPRQPPAPPRSPRPPRPESAPKPMPLPPKKEFVSRKGFMNYDDFLPPGPSSDAEESAPSTGPDPPNTAAPKPVSVTKAAQRLAHGFDDTKLYSDSTHDTLALYSKDYKAMKEGKVTTPTIPRSLWDDVEPVTAEPDVSNEEFEAAFKNLEGRILSGDSHELSNTPPPRSANGKSAPAVRADPLPKRSKPAVKSVIVPSWIKVLKDSFPATGVDTERGRRVKPTKAASSQETAPTVTTERQHRVKNSPPSPSLTAKASSPSIAPETVKTVPAPSTPPVASESAPSISTEAVSNKRFVWPKSGTAKPVGKTPKEYSLSWHKLDLSKLPATDRRIVFTTGDQLDEFNKPPPRFVPSAFRPGIMTVRAYPRRSMSHGGLGDLLAPTQAERDARAAAIAAYHASKRKVLPKLPVAGTYIKHVEPSTEVVILSVRSSKSKISNFSSERRASRTAARGALDLVANRTATPISPDYAYLCVVARDIFRTPMAELCAMVEDMMRELHQRILDVAKAAAARRVEHGGGGGGGTSGIGRSAGAGATRGGKPVKPDMRNVPKQAGHRGRSARVRAA